MIRDPFFSSKPGRSAFMFPSSRTPLARAAVFLGALALCGAAFAEPLNVVSSGGFAAAYKKLSAQYEQETGQQVHSEWGPSMGQTANAIPQRLARHEPIDV